MKIGNYEIREGLLYTKEHEWAEASGGAVKMGVTDYAAKTLNDVVYVTLPAIGDKVSQSKAIGTVESIKAVSELYSPLSGVVTRVNDALSSHPELVNKEPYGEGWLVEVQPDSLEAEKKNLLDASGYAALLQSLSVT